LKVRLGCFNSILGAPSGTETVAVVAECRLKHRTEYLVDSGLDEAVKHRWNTQQAHATIRFRDFDPFDRTGLIPTRIQFGTNTSPVRSKMVREFLNGHPIDPRRTPVALYLCQCLEQIVSAEDTFPKHYCCVLSDFLLHLI
jgi:hypothetical protein